MYLPRPGDRLALRDMVYTTRMYMLRFQDHQKLIGVPGENLPMEDNTDEYTDAEHLEPSCVDTHAVLITVTARARVIGRSLRRRI